MAFNPFNVFRRNQKAIFAVLTVFIMFMFTLSFGRGDFFEWLPRWLGSKKRTGEVLAVVDGRKVYESELGQLNRRRILANLYMSESGQRASVNLAKYVSEGAPRVSAENRTVIQQFLLMRQTNYIDQQTLRFASMGFIPIDRVAQMREQAITMLTADLHKIVTSPTPKEQDLDVARAAQSLLALDLSLAAAGPRGFYFSNQPNAGNRDLMNFILWRKKADELGIRFTDEDIDELVRVEFARKVSDEDLRAVREGLKGRQGFSPELLHEALADEFRVRAAQEAVLGRAYVRPAGVVYAAPYDYYQFYRDQTSPARFGVISVPVENYLDRVAGQPTEAELRDLFNKARNVEPDPALPRPGLKEPRRLKLEWAEVTGKEPYYTTAADEAVTKGEGLIKLGGWLIAGLAPGIGTAPLLATPPLTTPDILLQREYEAYLDRHKSAARDNWFSSPIWGAPKPLDNSVVQWPNVAALIGAQAGALATAGSPLGPAALFVGEAYAADRKARLAALQPALIAPIGPGVLALPEALVLGGVEGASAPPLPLAAVRSGLAEKAKEDLAQRLAREDIRKFQEELAKLGAKTDKAEARAKVEEFVKTRGVKHGESAEFRDQYTILDDPGLKPLKERAESANRAHSALGAPPLSQSGRQFFFEEGMPGQPEAPATGLYKPQFFPPQMFSAADPVFLVWRTAEQEAKAPRTLNDEGVRAKAEAAWRRAKARELAKQAADELAKQCTGLGSTALQIEPKLRDKEAQFAASFASPPARDRVKYFTLDNVAPLTRGRTSPLSPQPGPVGDYRVPVSENVPYPTAKMAEELLKTREKEPSTPVVVADQPEDTYYVAVLLERQDQSADLFSIEVYSPSAPPSGLGPVVWQRHQAEMRKQLYDRAIAMLKAEFNYEKEHESVNKKTEDTGE